MPIFRNAITAGNQFTGVDANTGLFQPATGSQHIQVQVNSLRFHAEGTPPVWTLVAVDPVDSSNTPLILTATDLDLTVQGMILAVESPTVAWGLRFVTTGMDGDGWLVIDYDFVETEG